MKHPVQPLELDEYGTLRFKENSIVTYLLDNGGISMNDLAKKSFCEEDREQFAQLIGYSFHGFSTLSYASEEVCKSALEEYEKSLGENK